MNTLSRREEETLLKSTKARALKECDPVVKGVHTTNMGCYESLSSRIRPQSLQTVLLDAQLPSHGHVETNIKPCKIVCCISEYLALLVLPMLGRPLLSEAPNTFP